MDLIQTYLEELSPEIRSTYELKPLDWQPPEITSKTAGALIDHTYLKSDANEKIINKICQEAKQYSFYSVCVNGIYAELAKSETMDSHVKVACVANFPLGSMSLAAQRMEVESISKHVDEIDFVLPFALVKDKKYTSLFEHLKQIRKATDTKTLKIILETCDLTKEEKIKSAIVAVAAGFDFLKTSTGFSAAGASVEDVRLLRMIAGEKASVKASGGIRDLSGLKEMVKAGANRIGCSAGVKIVTGEEAAKGAY